MRSANSVAGGAQAASLSACNRRQLADGIIISAGSQNGQASCLRSPELMRLAPMRMKTYL